MVPSSVQTVVPSLGPSEVPDQVLPMLSKPASTSLFFPVSKAGQSLEQIARAKAVCAGCPVRRQCLAFALRTGQVHGIWGSLTEEERHQAAKTSRGP